MAVDFFDSDRVAVEWDVFRAKLGRTDISFWCIEQGVNHWKVLA